MFGSVRESFTFGYCREDLPFSLLGIYDGECFPIAKQYTAQDALFNFFWALGLNTFDASSRESTVKPFGVIQIRNALLLME